MSGYRRGYNDDNPGMEMLQGVQAFGNAMRTGQQLEQGRMALEDEKGVNAAYEHIASKVGSTGDISTLDGDPLMNTRYGTMAAGKFLGQRAQNETSRLQMLKAMSASDDEFYSKTFRPLAFAADEAYKSGDMQRFGAISSELSAKAPLPYKTEMDTDGNFKLLFRSDKDGGWSDTGRKLSPQEVMNEIGGIIGGEQKILAGADMQQKVVNPRFLAAAARYRMGTIMGNADAMADPSKWIPMQKEGHTVWAVPQNRHDDYSAGPAYRIVDDSGKMGGMVGSLDELAQGGYVRADAKAKLAVLQKRANGGAGHGKGKPPTVAQLNAAENHAFKTTLEEEGVFKSGGQYVDADGEPVGTQLITNIRQKARAMAQEAYGLPSQRTTNTGHSNDPLGLGFNGAQNSTSPVQPQSQSVPTELHGVEGLSSTQGGSALNGPWRK